MSVTVYGSSDDLIEVDGDIYEEFNHMGSEDAILGFENGAVLRVRYDENGVWRITPVIGASLVTIVQAPEGDDDNYSDRATMVHAGWVVYGSEVAKAKAAS